MSLLKHTETNRQTDAQISAWNYKPIKVREPVEEYISPGKTRQQPAVKRLMWGIHRHQGARRE